MFNFKELFTGIILIFILGIAGFLYRNAMEQPILNVPKSTACTLEVKKCPDGTFVGRTGSSCRFSTCPVMNTELKDIGVSFVLPKGFKSIATSSPKNESAGIVYEATLAKEDSSTQNITLRVYPLSEKNTAKDIMLGETVFDSTGLSPQSMNDFKKVTIGANTFEEITIGSSKKYMHVAYFLLRKNDVLRFDIKESGEVNASDISAMRTLLQTLQISKN
ncbi:MAG TPA: hypothetical protein ENJ75_02860 [Candidatus Kaiserbacteria bacterium]|nr:hypothetical protein [Candidatus Kaiserbacteria bacterium]